MKVEIYKLRNAKDCHQTQGERHKIGSFIALRSSNFADALVLDFQPPNCEKINFYCFSHPVRGTEL